MGGHTRKPADFGGQTRKLLAQQHGTGRDTSDRRKQDKVCDAKVRQDPVSAAQGPCRAHVPPSTCL